ncbi:MAG TPA: nucleoside triphosphate pyrophosphohydrolase [Spirochaetota bacterium]|nr:nucleoside triphosphate pyrophosphohydrolase [Spirochaetota bacterium]HPC41882.1 nucleoside triphosphate pyrophosphohydrolase [Spirochaetota bacterium]HPL18130.1 nucleoside triphosphate pyrophosphohydrolase [Spirochaetota bacterium]HQF09593.1 nucleoside triphosphate pyrophosphohydrolase [Spirochaetota bacterium]HQH98337.1 nucleoside triphosphate pyrophosphohydrolase [Spirochaetota bacterium]
MEFKEKRPLYQFAEIIAALRGENGCPWDRKQTHESLRPYLIEEAYEALDAIESGDPVHIREELGDILLQIYLHAEIARERNQFTIDDVARSIIDKIILRHPHVFGDATVRDADHVADRWEQIKKAEKPHRKSLLDGVPKHLPALLKAYRIQQKVSRVGFDWERIEDVAAKLDEETGELKAAMASSDREKITDEAGDILFSIANLLRFMHINPEEALEMTIGKFTRRFQYIEQRAAEMEKNLEEMTIDEMESLWQESKDRV